jgi:hypothetical protein
MGFGPDMNTHVITRRINPVDVIKLYQLYLTAITNSQLLLLCVAARL